MSTIYPGNPILIIDDEPMVLRTCSTLLKFHGLNNVISCDDSREALKIAQEQVLSVIVLDLRMPFISGDDLLNEFTSNYPNVPVLVLTGMNTVEKAVTCMKNGAYDYLVKPVDDTRFATAIERAINYHDMQMEVMTRAESVIDKKLDRPDCFSNILSRNNDVLHLYKYAESISISNQPILITGESGTGKSEIAKSIHRSSNRAGNFIMIGVAGLDDNIFADTLFGHRKGAFTGAFEDRLGLIQKAEGGTLFLDEIGDMTMQSQIKLLQLIQDRTFSPLGSDEVKRANIRIIAATNVNLYEKVRSGKFRNDLYHRLNTHSLRMLPLRDRLDDLSLLLDHFFETAANDFQRQVPVYPVELISLLKNYSFPGNIRELKSMVFDAMAEDHSKKISLKAFKRKIFGHNHKIPKQPVLHVPMNEWQTLPSLNNMKEMLVREALKRTGGNQSMAAEMIGVSRTTLIKFMNQ